MPSFKKSLIVEQFQGNCLKGVKYGSRLHRNDLRGNKNYFKLAGDSSFRGYNYSKCKTKFQGESILVGDSARFELSGVNFLCIPSWAYPLLAMFLNPKLVK